jgi:hypothetical protein
MWSRLYGKRIHNEDRSLTAIVICYRPIDLVKHFLAGLMFDGLNGFLKRNVDFRHFVQRSTRYDERTIPNDLRVQVQEKRPSVCPRLIYPSADRGSSKTLLFLLQVVPF